MSPYSLIYPNMVLKFYNTLTRKNEVVKLIKDVEVPLEVKKLADERLLAKKNKDIKKADQLRDKIKVAGFSINDIVDGYEINKL
jgi:cysteinyl-tRNA synthetase